MAKLTLKKKRPIEDDLDEDVKPKKKMSMGKSVKDDDEEYSDDDFFQEGAAIEWANQHAPQQQNFKPEFWISEEEKRNRIAFTDTKPMATLLIHSIRDGKNFGNVTCCSSTRPCKYCEVAAKDSPIGTKYSVFLWQIRQLNKWTDKEGKTHYVTNRFWRLPKTKTEMLMKTLAKYGDEALSTMFEAVSGGKDSKGAFNLVGTPLSERWEERIEEGPELYGKSDLRKYYAPPTDAEAEAHIRRLLKLNTQSKGRDEDDDDDDLDD